MSLTEHTCAWCQGRFYEGLLVDSERVCTPCHHSLASLASEGMTLRGAWTSVIRKEGWQKLTRAQSAHREAMFYIGAGKVLTRLCRVSDEDLRAAVIALTDEVEKRITELDKQL